MRILGADLARILGADFGVDFITGCSEFGCGFFAEGAKPQNRAFS